MEPTDHEQQHGDGQQGDNWLAGATIEAGTEGFTPEPVMLALNDIGLEEQHLHDEAGRTEIA
jgi:hypothetical protein